MNILGMLFYKFNTLKTATIRKYLTTIVHSNGGRLAEDVRVSHPENIYIGRNSFVNGGQLLAGNSSAIKIGRDCMISYNVHLRIDYHNYENMETPMRYQGRSEKDITINCWIGFGA